MPQPQKCAIKAMSATYIRDHGNAGSLTHWVRPGIEPTSSWILVRLIYTEPWWELLFLSLWNFLLFVYLFVVVLCQCLWHAEVPGPGAEPVPHNSDLSCWSDNNGSLTHCTMREFQKFLFCFVLFLNQEWVLNFINCFFCINWYSHVIFLLSTC